MKTFRGICAIAAALTLAVVDGAHAAPARPDLFRFLLERRFTMNLSLAPSLLAVGEESATADDAQNALRWRYLSLREPHGKIPPGALYNANLHRRDMLHRGVHGHSVGPSRVSILSISPTAWTSRGPANIGGRTRALLVDSNSPSTLYAGAIGGGIWKSTDSGSTWTTNTDFMKNLAVSSMVFDPANHATIYAATGEVLYLQLGDYDWLDGDSVSGLHGAGIFVSHDSGGTWSQLSNTSNWAAVSRIAISPNGATLLAATTNGLSRSTDSGGTWQDVTPTGASFSFNDAETVLFDPSDSTRAVMSIIVYQNTGVQGWYHRIYYSSDGGATWTQATTPSISPDFNMRTEFAWASSAGSTATVYADVAVAAGSASGEVWKSTDNGHTFSRVSSQGVTDCTYGHCAIWVSPTNANLLVTGGVGLARSTDGGATFSSLGAGYIATADPHPDFQLIVADPAYNDSGSGTVDKKVYVCTDGGIFSTNDITTAAMNNNNWSSLNSSYQTAEYYSAAGNAAGGIYAGGTQDNGSLALFPASGTSADYYFGGDGGWVAIDYYNPSTVYGEYTSLQMVRSTAAATQGSGGFIYALDSANPLSDASVSNNYSLTNFIAPFVMDPLTPTTLLAGGQHLWRTTNASSAAPSWTSIRNAVVSNPSNPGDSNVSAIAVWRFSSDIVWVAQNDGTIQKTSNGTAASPSWTTVTGPASRYVTRLYIDPADSNVVYVTYGGYHPDNVWKTTNGGTTWTSLAGTGLNSLPAVPVRSIVRHPRDSRMLFVSTDAGVFESDDGGANWIVPNAESDGPAETGVDELQFVEGSETLLAGTYGRGMFTYGLSSVPSYFPAGLNAAIVAGTPTTIHVSWNAYTGASSYQLFRSSGGGAYSQIGGTITGTTYDDSGLSAGTTYLYKVKAVVGGTPTDASAPDLATTVTFTNDNDLHNRAVSSGYLTEVRNAVNDVLVAAGMATQTFSGGGSNVAIRATDVTDLRTALIQAYRHIGMPSPPSFPSGTVGTGTFITAAQTQEIRDATK